MDESQLVYTIDLHSDSDKEKFETISFTIGKESSSIYVPVIKPHKVWNYDNLKYETHGYTITVDKIEFYDDETHVYVTATNDGKATLYVDSDNSVIVQDKKQINTETIYNADYEELPHSIARGASVKGIILFPAVQTSEFEYTIAIHSDDYSEEFKDIVFTINEKTPYCQNDENEAWRLIAIINAEPYDLETNELSISKYNPIYLHLHLIGGQPGAKIRIKEVITYPDGQTRSNVYDGTYSANHIETRGCKDGIYTNPKYGVHGTLNIIFYNADTGEKIGEASVKITN